MNERFTERSVTVMRLANQEAHRFNHEYVGTEHLLLGLIKEGSGVGANVLKNLDVDLRKIRLEIEKLVQSGPDSIVMGELPQTPRVKKVLEDAVDEAKNLGHNYVGTEHLLLGVLRQQEGVAVQVLNNLGIKVDDVRYEVMSLLGMVKGKINVDKFLSLLTNQAANEFLEYSKGQKVNWELIREFFISRGAMREEW